MATLTSALQGLFDKASSLSGASISSDYYKQLGFIESSWNPNISASKSSAGGVFQFLGGTWASYGTGSKYGTGDNVASAIAKFTTDNYNALKSALGRAPTDGELYLAHQQGAGGALKLLLNPSADATSIVGYDAVVNNGGTVGMTAGAFANLWTSKFGDTSSSSGGGSLLGNIASALNPGTYISAAAGVNTGSTDTAKAITDSAAKTQEGWIEWLSSGAVRVVVVVLGFIFVAVGLAMFKPGIVVNAIPAARAVKGAASAANSLGG